ncbi:MAG: magnesium transporter CorA family protein [Acidimicrobiales bacterium]
MTITIMHIDAAGAVRDLEQLDPSLDGWHWVDIMIDPGHDPGPPPILDQYRLDQLAVHDAFNEIDVPKFEDFGSHLSLILHGLRDDERLSTYELDCFITATDLITVHQGASRAIEALQSSIRHHPELASGGADEVAARLADGVTRRLLAVVDAFDERADELVVRALVADRTLLHDVSAIRSDLAAIRRIVLPQREALDLIRTSDSALLSRAARRRFSDVFDVAARTAYGLDAARSLMSEAIDSYRGAESRLATEVTRVLTIYAAILLPLSLIVGFFGMNHENLPTIGERWGWPVVTGAMVIVVVVSLGVFVSQGWISRPSGKAAGEALGRGLVEAARAPAQVASAVFAISTLSVNSAMSRLEQGLQDPATPDED